MKPSKQEIHPEICNEDAHEGKNAEDMKVLRFAEPFQRSLMDAERIDEHGDQCPYLLRIPSPVSSPRNVCPYRTDEDSGSQQEKGRIEHDVADGLEIFHSSKSNALIINKLAFWGRKAFDSYISVFISQHLTQAFLPDQL